MKNIRFTQTLVLPRGFRASGIIAGLKKSGRKDLAIIVSDFPAVMAGVFTTNQVKAAPVKLCQKKIRSRRGQAIVINSGIANACTGIQGYRNAELMARLAANALGVPAELVYVCSTGRIGVQLPMDILEQGIHTAAKHLSHNGGLDAAEAIMTTDTRPKYCTATFRVGEHSVRVAAMAKGAGMIEPKMATMLAFFLTDAAVQAASLQSLLRQAVADSFNRITVDGDRSTNDTVLFMANGAAQNVPALSPSHPNWNCFAEAVKKVAFDLALKIIADGEGATKFITVRVQGARNDREADIAARAVANSLLVKTSWAGNYLNWGRIMDALGYSAAKVDENRVDIAYDGVLVVRRGISAGTDLATQKAIGRKKSFIVNIDLHLGRGSATVYTCDCTEEYVRINM